MKVIKSKIIVCLVASSIVTISSLSNASDISVTPKSTSIPKATSKSFDDVFDSDTKLKGIQIAQLSNEEMRNTEGSFFWMTPQFWLGMYAVGRWGLSAGGQIRLGRIFR